MKTAIIEHVFGKRTAAGIKDGVIGVGTNEAGEIRFSGPGTLWENGKQKLHLVEIQLDGKRITVSAGELAAVAALFNQ